MSTIALTQHQIHMMRHALGLPNATAAMRKKFERTGETYRNHYCASSEDAPEWRSMVASGLATEGRASELTGGDAPFFVSDAGKQWLKEAGL